MPIVIVTMQMKALPMSDLSTNKSPAWLPLKLDKAWVAFGVILALVALFVPAQFFEILQDTVKNLGTTGVFIGSAVLLIAYLRATGAEAIVGRAFQGNPVHMVVFASLVGGLAPFCSCEVIPFIAALLAMGTPLAAVMAFWLSSPIMDPPMFVITSSTLGIDFAVAKTIGAVGFGLLGGFGVMALSRTGLFANPLRETPVSSGCCGTSNPFDGQAQWQFWQDAERIRIFKTTAIENALFLVKWLALAYLLEAIMIRFVPAEWIAGALGGDGAAPILLGAALGGPAYLNGYAAVPLVHGMINQGMSQGAAMSFMMAGSVTCIPAAIAVWALVKPRVFMGYLGFAFIGAIAAGFIWSTVSGSL